MEQLNSLTQVRSFCKSGSLNDVTLKTAQLSESRLKIIRAVEDFSSNGGIEQPIEAITEVFSEYLRSCEFLEKLALIYDVKGGGSDALSEQMGRIRGEFLPPYASLSTNFWILKELILFVVRSLEAGSRAELFEHIVGAQSKG